MVCSVLRSNQLNYQSAPKWCLLNYRNEGANIEIIEIIEVIGGGEASQEQIRSRPWFEVLQGEIEALARTSASEVG
jgi:hypothetical protein